MFSVDSFAFPGEPSYHSGSFGNFGAVDVSRQIPQAEQNIVTPHHQVRFVERQAGRRPPRGVEVRHRESLTGGPAGAVEPLPPETPMTVARGNEVDQPSVRRP